MLVPASITIGTRFFTAETLELHAKVSYQNYLVREEPQVLLRFLPMPMPLLVPYSCSHVFML